MVAGRHYSAGTRVVTWLEPGGYDAYRRVAPDGTALAENHSFRRRTPEEPAPAAPPNLARVREMVDQFVLHCDTIGLSGPCFDILQRRGLSVHFLLDVDGTIYQTLDLRERAYHATIANSRSIGIELANPGAYPTGMRAALDAVYRPDDSGRIRFVPLKPEDANRILTPGFVARPDRPEPVHGRVHAHDLVQYDYTPEQYAALIKLTAALHRVFPKIRLDYPRDADGRLVMKKLPDAELEAYHGVIGHFHIQENKVDPGPAMQWDRLIEGARSLQQ